MCGMCGAWAASGVGVWHVGHFTGGRKGWAGATGSGKGGEVSIDD